PQPVSLRGERGRHDDHRIEHVFIMLHVPGRSRSLNRVELDGRSWQAAPDIFQLPVEDEKLPPECPILKQMRGLAFRLAVSLEHIIPGCLDAHSAIRLSPEEPSRADLAKATLRQQQPKTISVLKLLKLRSQGGRRGCPVYVDGDHFTFQNRAALRLAERADHV